MNERENLTASQEARRDILSRAGHTPTSGDPVQRLIDAAIYRETHRTKPAPGQGTTASPDEAQA